MKNRPFLKRISTLYFPLVALCILVILRNYTKGTDDLDIYIHASQKLELGQNLYKPPFFNTMHYLYPPFLAWVLQPMNHLPMGLVKWIFMLFNLLLLWRVLFISTRVVKKETHGITVPIKFILPISACLIHFSSLNFQSMQVTYIVVWSLVEAWWQSYNGRYTAAGFAIAFGAIIKVMPAFLIIYWFAKRQNHSIIRGLQFMLLFTLIPAITVGWSTNVELLTDWVKLVNPLQNNHFAIGEKASSSDWQGISSILYMFFHDLEAGFGAILLNVLRIGFLAYAYINARVKRLGMFSDFGQVAFLMATLPMIFPHQRMYEYLLFIPLLVYLSLRIDQMGKGSLFYMVFLILCILFVGGSDTLGRKLYELFFNLRGYVFCALGLLGLYVWIEKKEPMEKVIDPLAKPKN